MVSGDKAYKGLSATIRVQWHGEVNIKLRSFGFRRTCPNHLITLWYNSLLRFFVRKLATTFSSLQLCQNLYSLVLNMLVLLGRIDAAYCYRPSSVVCQSVICLSVCHTSEPCKNGCTDQDAVWVDDSGGPREPCVRLGSRSPHGKGQILGGEWASHCEA